MDTYSDVLEDLPYERSPLRVCVGGVEQDEGFLDASYAQDLPVDFGSRFANAYARYFHTDYSLFEIDNPQAPDATLLIIGDSYTNNMERFFAEHYSCVYVADTRYCEPLDALIERVCPDDVVFILGPGSVVAPYHFESLMHRTSPVPAL